MDENVHASTPGASPEGNFLTRAVWTLVSPRRLFDDVARDAPWWQPFVWVSLLNMVVAYLSTPIQKQLVRLNPNEVPPEQLQETLAAMDKFAVLGMVTTPVVVLLTSLVIAGISYIAVSVLAQAPSFRRHFTIYLYASLPVSVGLLLGTLVTHQRGIENIRSIEDAVASFGPAALLEPGQRILYPVLSTLDLFSIWFYVLVAMGASYVFGMKRGAALLVVIPVWLIYLLFALVGSRISVAA